MGIQSERKSIEVTMNTGVRFARTSRAGAAFIQ